MKRFQITYWYPYENIENELTQYYETIVVDESGALVREKFKIKYPHCIISSIKVEKKDGSFSLSDGIIYVPYIPKFIEIDYYLT
jgi:hypothetical protein